MKLLILLFLFGLNANVVAQYFQVENLKSQIAISSDDSVKVNLLADLSYLYTNIDLDSAIQIAQNGISLAKQLEYQQGEASCLISLGRAYMHFGNNDLALEKLTDALQISEKFKNQHYKGLAIINIALIYAYLQNSALSLNYALQAKKIAEEINDSTLLVGYLLKLCDSYSNKEDTVLILANMAKKISMELRDTIGWARSLAYISVAYNKLGNKLIGLNYRQESLTLDLAIGNNRGAAQNYLAIAETFAEVNKIDSALHFANKSLSIAKKYHFAFIEINVLSTLSSLYEQKNDKEALRYYKMFTVANDSFFSIKKAQQINNIESKQQIRIREEEIMKKAYRNRIIQFALIVGLTVFLLTALILYRNNQHKQKINLQLGQTLKELKATEAQLIQSEKMASLGELTAGIAHEIQNPLNFVNNFSDINRELMEELKSEKSKVKSERDEELENQLLSNIEQNLEKINHHGKRADAIVKGMLQHSKTSSGHKELTDINALADEYLRLAYHGLRAKDKSFNATMKTDFDESIGKINIIPQDIGRVILNLINNAFYAVDEKKKQVADGYEPTVIVSSKKVGDKIEIEVRDNGNGVPQKVIDKIFQPFFTTKPTGQGTGLGLSLAYDIVKAHGGEIKVEAKENEGSVFTIELPIGGS